MDNTHKIIGLLRNFPKLNTFASLRLSLNDYNNDSEGLALMYGHAALKLSKTAKALIKKGAFHFNRKWTNNDPFQSILSIGKNALLEVENNFSIYSGSRVYINDNAHLILGKGYINNNLNLSCFEKIEIGRGVSIAENVFIRDSDNHAIAPYDKDISKPIKIGDHVWIGSNVTILKGVTIGSGAIIAAGSVVNHDIPANCMAAGVPAVVVKEDVEWRA